MLVGVVEMYLTSIVRYTVIGSRVWMLKREGSVIRREKVKEPKRKH